MNTNHLLEIIATVFVMITFFAIIGSNAISAIKTFLAPPLVLIGEIVVMIGAGCIAFWLGMLFYRFFA